ncbi:hypothetical protein O181_018396 [Austropuccinia psidii MF-1]|uniref:Epidermal growth factor receptor substrate 15-like 1 n=1 Tax=Austropuccinia psidii MF-1 TaxID=1389203 RepID=A0A9Q3C582_9BASI|nr:hypothetical protein [Austropuccinia psidii MF-1]
MAPSEALVLSPDERIAYPYLFSKADTDQIGVLVGEKAVAFFAHSKLPPTILGEIWQLADQDNAGFLTRQQFDIALRLIGKAQRSLPINEAAISTPGPLCRLEGFNIPGLSTPTSPPLNRSLNTSLAPSDTLAPDPLSTITKEDKAKYTRMFINAGPQDGLLDGDKARDIFIRSKLPFEKLAQIWTLADTQSRGALSVGDFCIAMHLIQFCMSRASSTLPTTVPKSLLESAAGPDLGSVMPISRQVTGQQLTAPLSASIGSRQPISTTIRPEYTGRSVSGTSLVGPANLKSSTNLGSPIPLPWDISPAELAQSNIYFDSLDTNRLGFITGDRAVPFMMESKLPGEILARIWDLADIRGEGKLNREEFAVAMRLIQNTLAGGLESLMSKLPPTMVPPSLRTPTLPAIQETSDTQRDLLSLMDDTDSPPAAASATFKAESTQNFVTPLQSSVPPQSTGANPTAPGSRIMSPSSLGQGALLPQSTGLSLGSGVPAASLSLAEDSGAKLGNLHTQLASTENALLTAREERSRLEAMTGSTSEQIKLLELKLSSARAALQSESPVVEGLRAKQAEQRLMVTKLTSEVITAESELSALKIEKEQIEGNILRDKEEVRGMQKRVSELEEESLRLKSTLEALKKDSRLQRGLIAIGKKQLSTAEGSRDEALKEVNVIEEQLNSLTLASDHSRVSSPALASANSSLLQKSTNPFERMLLASPGPSPTPYQFKADASSPSDLTTSTFGAKLRGNSPDPFSSSTDNALSFQDTFGLSETSAHDGAIETPVPTRSSTSQSQAHSSGKLMSNVESTSNYSSDEDQIEDAIPASRQGMSSNLANNKFPPLEDAQAPLERKGETLESDSSKTASPKESETTDDIKGVGLNSNESRNLPHGDAQTQCELPSSITNNVKIPDQDEKKLAPKPASIHAPGFSEFGDDLEISDFAADFETTTSKPTGATLEDFESAFASLPPSSQSNALKSAISPERENNAHIASFDDAFGGDAFLPTQEPNKQDQLGFDESFAGFDDAFKNQLGEKVKPDEDPFGSPAPDTTSKAPPALPTRPSDSVIANLDVAKPTDSQAVQQICAMGFARSVAIQALERDEWNMERALNHLLGS